MFFSKLRSASNLAGSARAMAAQAPVRYIAIQTLSEKILAEREAEEPSYAIIDVREEDHLGGHIKGSQHVPIVQLDAMMPTLIRRLKDKKTVVFHCMLSQQRGPDAARRYMQEREAALGKEAADGQIVYVLGRGFDGWQQEYQDDERLTEGFRKDLWADRM